MDFLMHIGFDNSSRLWKKVFYFEYKGIRFKLIQNNPRKWCDVLLTIIPSHNNEESKNEAYFKASEFLSALSWANNSLVKVQELGGRGFPDDSPLEKAKCYVFGFPKAPFSGLAIGYTINRIPEIETEEQRDALTLFREARSSNNYYLSFLFYWQILEIGGNEPIGWINKAYRKNRNKFYPMEDVLRLLNGKSLGNYFHDDCRNSIAHIFTRFKGRKKLKIDSPADNMRIRISNRAIEQFANFYICDKLKLRKSMYLVKIRGQSFPLYINEQSLGNYSCKIAYERPSRYLDKIFKKKLKNPI